MSLSAVKIGERVQVKGIWGDENMRNRLETLGFTVDSDVCVVSKAYGNMIINVNNTRVAMSEELARKIMV